MKRVLSLLLVLVMALSLAACGQNDGKQSGNNASSDGSASVSNQGTIQSTGTEATQGFEFPADLPPKKVGAVGIYTGNELYVQWKENLSSLGEKFNIEFQLRRYTLPNRRARQIEIQC